MSTRKMVLLLALSFLFLVPAHGEETIVDLGHSLRAGDPSWSGETVFGRTEMGGENFQMGKFFSDEHFGTHLDAPSHFSRDGWTVDEIPAERLMGPACRIDISDRAARDPDYQLQPADIRAFESAHGRIPASAIVLVATGWSARWPGAGYLNEKDGVKHFPGISVEAARLLIDRQVAGIVIDTASVDYGPSTRFETHLTTMPENLFHVENATNLLQLPPSGFRVLVAPVKLAGGSGGPTRIFALLP